MTLLKRALYLIVLTCAACNLSPQGSADVTPTAATIPTEAPTSTPEVTLNTYTNTAYGYTIQYPDGLTVDGDETSQYLWLGDHIWIMVSDANPEQSMGDAPLIESAQDAMIGTNTARRLSGYIGAVGGGIPQRYESFVIANNNRYYQFIAYELTRGDLQPLDRTMGAVPADVVALLEQVVTTLRFTA